MVTNNWGRIPFIAGSQPPPQQTQQPQPQSQPTSQWTNEQIVQQINMFQRLQQMQVQFPKNLNLRLI